MRNPADFAALSLCVVALLISWHVLRSSGQRGVSPIGQSAEVVRRSQLYQDALARAVARASAAASMFGKALNVASGKGRQNVKN